VRDGVANVAATGRASPIRIIIESNEISGWTDLEAQVEADI
jgi:hypothetical protein